MLKSEPYLCSVIFWDSYWFMDDRLKKQDVCQFLEVSAYRSNGRE